jgi:hypothetical protein
MHSQDDGFASSPADGFASSSADGFAEGSFRDRHSRVLHRDGRVVRVMDESAAADWHDLAKSAFLVEAMAQGRVTPTREVELAAADISDPRWVLALEHEPIPFLSWPYEWSFGMLRDAALLHLELLGEALDAGFTMKDGSAYNLQWTGVRPSFIDLGSFERWRSGEPWAGYRQFCQLMLFPLLLQSHLDVDFQPLLRGSLEGLDAGFVNKAFGLGRRFRKGVFAHVYLQSALTARVADTERDVKKDLKSAGFSQELVKTNARRMRKLIEGLSWKRSRSEWGDYTQEHNYSDADHERKAAFVRDAAARCQPGLCWDLGANTGQFSAIAAEHSDYVIAADVDSLAVERHYRKLRSDGPTNVLPIVFDIADPSPALGWRRAERGALEDRGRPDLILALALIHHLVISANLPMQEVIAWLGGLTRRALVIEFVSREDGMVKRLLRNREDQYHDYRPEVFETCLREHFEIESSLEVNEGRRRLFHCRKR